jgi:pimeloyl-ACP methyl ester carboxylesterase
MARRAAVRFAFRLGDRLAPGRAARVAGDLWFTPPRPRRGAPAEPPGGEAFAVELGDATIHGTVWGDSGPRIYFMHGWGGRGADVAAQVPGLLARGCQVITFDGPAHGRSGPLTAGPRRTNAIELGRALAAVVAHHGPADAVIAHSLGTVAVSFALRSGELACDRLVLLAPVIEAGGQLAAFCRHLGIGARTRGRLGREIRRHTGTDLAEFRLLGAGDRAGVRDVLVVHDRDDPIVAYQATVSHVRAWSAATLVTTGGLGHYRLLKDPSVTRVVADAIGRGAVDRTPASGPARTPGHRPAVPALRDLRA